MIGEGTSTLTSRLNSQLLDSLDLQGSLFKEVRGTIREIGRVRSTTINTRGRIRAGSMRQFTAMGTRRLPATRPNRMTKNLAMKTSTRARNKMSNTQHCKAQIQVGGWMRDIEGE